MNLLGYDITVIRSTRRTLSLEVTRDARVVVRVPEKTTDRKIAAFVSEHADWLKKHTDAADARMKRAGDGISAEKLESLKQSAEYMLPLRVALFAESAGLTYGKIRVRLMSSRWGSCSPSNDLCFNSLLMLAPGYVTDYIIVHELAHTVQHNHSRAFWKEVGRIMPEYKMAKDWLSNEGRDLIAMVYAK